MIDESIDGSVTGHVVVFVIIVDEWILDCIFGFIWGDKNNVKVIYNFLLKLIEEWEFNIQKCFKFGYGGITTMLGQRSGLAIILINLALLIYQLIAMHIGPP